MAQSYKEYTGSELTATTFSVPFKYLSINDVNALGFDGTKWNALALHSSTPRDAVNKTITLAAAPNTLYTTLRLYRATSTTQLIDFQNGSRLSESDLDAAYQQSLFVAQEIAEDASTTQFTAVAAASLQAGTSLSNFASEEIVSDATNGLIDGTNAVFNITAFTPQTTVKEAYRVSIDGVMQSPTDAYSITISPAQITFTSAPPVGSKIVVVTAASAASAVSVDDVTIGLTSANKAEIKDLGVTNAKLAGSITQDKLAGSIATSKLAEVIDDDTMTTGVSATSLASSESIKAFVDSLIGTADRSTASGLVTEGEQGSLTLGGGLIIKFGSVNKNSSSNKSVTFQDSSGNASPFPNGIYGVNATSNEGSVASGAEIAAVTSPTVDGFQLQGFGGSTNIHAAIGRVFFIAIGY